MDVGEMFVRLGVKPGDLSGLDQVNAKVRQSLAESVGGFEKTTSGLYLPGGPATADPKVRTEVEKTTSAKVKDTSATNTMAKAHQGLIKTLSGVVNPLNMLRVKMLAVFGAMTYATDQAGKYSAALTRFQLVTGLSMQGLQALQQQFALSGVSAEETTGAVEGLQRAAAEIKLGGGNLAPWAILGIDPRSDPFTTLRKIQERMKAIPTEYSTAALRQLGLTNGVIAALHEMASIPPPNADFLLSDKEIKRLKEFNVYWNRVWDEGHRGLMKIGYAVLPVVDWIVYGIHRISLAVTRLVNFFGGIANGLREVKVFAAGALAILFAMFAGPLLPITLLILALEDLSSYLHGDKSVIGDAIAYFSDWRNVIEDVATWLQVALSYMGELADMIGRVTGLWNSDFAGAIGKWAEESNVRLSGESGRLATGGYSAGMYGPPIGAAGKSETNVSAPITVNQQNSFALGNMLNGTANSATPLYDKLMNITRDSLVDAINQSPLAEFAR